MILAYFAIDSSHILFSIISQAQEGDLIVVAGKGHEEYQEIEGHFYPMNEREMIENSI